MCECRYVWDTWTVSSIHILLVVSELNESRYWTEVDSSRFLYKNVFWVKSS